MPGVNALTGRNRDCWQRRINKWATLGEWSTCVFGLWSHDIRGVLGGIYIDVEKVVSYANSEIIRQSSKLARFRIDEILISKIRQPVLRFLILLCSFQQAFDIYSSGLTLYGHKSRSNIFLPEYHWYKCLWWKEVFPEVSLWNMKMVIGAISGPFDLYNSQDWLMILWAILSMHSYFTTWSDGSFFPFFDWLALKYLPR